MIIHKFIKNKGIVHLTLEDADDLWCLKRIIEPGDLVSGETTRVIKHEGFYSRPDKGERVKVRVTISVESAKFDSSLERLRISGKILEISNDITAKGSFHSIIATPNYTLYLKKDHWKDLDQRILSESVKKSERFIIVAMDMREAGIGAIKGTHLQIISTIESGLMGKHYDLKEKPLTLYYDQVAQIIISAYEPSTRIFLSGPGHIKNSFANFLLKIKSDLKDNLRIIDGIDVTGEDGIYMILRSPQFKKQMEESKLVQVSNLLEQAIKRVSDGDEKVAFTFNEVKEASKLGAIDSVLISNKIFNYVSEDDLVELLNSVETFHGKSYMIDSTTEISAQVMALGGIVALLRFSPK